MPRLLLLDNYDSFTYNLYDYLLQAGATCQVVRNDALALDDFERLGFEGIVLSPGPKRPADAGVMMDLIARWHRRVPVLGICLGHQAIGEYYGAELLKAPLPMHGKTSWVNPCAAHPIFEGLPARFPVMRYHSLLLASLEGTPLQVLARTDSGQIMALAHTDLPLTGLQFHPESVLTPHGLQMIGNWVRAMF